MAVKAMQVIQHKLVPGMLPVLNKEAIRLAARAAKALNSEVARISRFDRKHYFYPDLPKGYQISQYDEPLCQGGSIEFFFAGKKHAVRLNRIHMEEDAGKNVHVSGTKLSLVDLNRAGVPLIEIVSEPDLRTSEEAAEYLRAIRKLVRFLGISDGNMEEGSLRCDANVSIRPKGQKKLETKVEIKNINSFKFVQKAIEHEIARQIEVVQRGGTIFSETRGWDAGQGVSHSQRKKEQASDYRYFPDPDLPPLVISNEWLEKVRRNLPETPLKRYHRYTQTLGLSDYDANVLTAEPELGSYFDQTLQKRPTHLTEQAFAKLAANWIASELLGALHKEGKSILQSQVSPETLAELITLIADGQMSGKVAKEIFAEVYVKGGSPKELVQQKGLVQMTDPTAIEEICRQVLSDPTLQQQIEKYQQGNERLFGFFVGLIMKQTQGRAKPELVNEILKQILKPSS